MGQPDWADAETVLEQGRHRWTRDADDLPATVVEQGRDRGVPHPAARPELPPDLARRFDVEQVLRWRPAHATAGATRADVYLASERASGQRRVVKVYRSDLGPDRDVQEYLSGPHSRHVVRVVEHSRSSTPPYEVMEHVPGPTLAEFYTRAAEPFLADQIKQVVQQLADALADMHRLGVVHLDLKPANIIVRRSDPLDLVVIDFGIAAMVPEVDETVDLDPPAGTPPYLPPQWMSEGSAARDYWALGMIVWELIAGRPHFSPSYSPRNIQRNLTTYSMDVSGVTDPRRRLLLRGLFVRNPRERWGRDEIGRWLVGESPPIASEPVLPAYGPGAQQGFEFAGRLHRHRRALAATLHQFWDRAVSELFGAGRLAELRAWLDQFPDAGKGRATIDEVTAAKPPPHLALLRVIRAIYPGLPPRYRNTEINGVSLVRVAHEAMSGDRHALEVVRDLRQHGLLRELSHGPSDELHRIHGSWVRLDRDWRRLAGALPHQPARDEIDRHRASGYLAAVQVRAVLAGPAAEQRLRRGIDATVRGRPPSPDWFTEIAYRSEYLWLAHLLRALAQRESREREAEAEAENRRLQARLDGREGYEWARGQARPTAVAWAVAGVTAMTALWMALLVLGDLVNWADNTAVQRAWVAGVGWAGVSLIAESMLAVDAGGRFHPAYSMPGGVGMALGRAGTWVQGRGLVGMVILIGLVGSLFVAAAVSPIVVPTAMIAGHLIWVGVRLVRWRSAQRAEDAEIDEFVRDRQRTTGGPAPAPAEGGVA